MIPYKDDNPTKTFPFFTIAFIVLNIIVFLWELIYGPQSIAFRFGAIPHALVTMSSEQPIHPVLTVFSSMFLHGGFLHLGGNMLYLWIFGNNIEDVLGHGKFVIFYLLGGAVSTYAHAVTDPGSAVPMIGASGAVSAVLGAYILLFPRAQVYTILFFGFFIQVVRLPALIVIGFWAIIQLVSALLAGGTLGGGGVAWFAHVGGFIFGVVFIKLFMQKRRRRLKWS